MEQLWEGRPWGGVGVSSRQAPLGSAYLTPDRFVGLAKARGGGKEEGEGGPPRPALAPQVTPSLEATG